MKSPVSTLLFVCLILASPPSSNANPIPIADHAPVNIASEKLDVKVGPDAAEFEGHFRFRAVLQSNAGADPMAHISIPIWIARERKGANVDSQMLLENFPTTGVQIYDHSNPWNEKQRKAWDSIINLKVSVGRKPLPLNSWIFADCESKYSSGFSNIQGAMPKGYLCIFASVSFPRKRSGDCEVTISYRQPLRKLKDGSSEFYYLPIFANLPPERSTASLEDYSMKLTTSARSALSFGGFTIVPNHQALLSLAADEPIIGKVMQR